MEPPKSKPFSFLEAPNTFQEDATASRPSVGYDFQRSGSAIDSFRLTPSLIKPASSPLRGGKLKDSDLAARPPAKDHHANDYRASPLASSHHLPPTALNFDAMRPYALRDDPALAPAPARQEYEPDPRLREPQTARAYYSRSLRPEVLPSPAKQRSPSPHKGGTVTRQARVERLTPHKMSPRAGASPSRAAPSAAGLALGHLEERMAQLESENDMLRGELNRCKDALAGVEEARMGERKQYDEKLQRELEQSLKRETQIKKRCNYTSQEIEHLRAQRTEAENERVRIEGLYKIILEEKAAKEQEAKLTVQKMDRTLKELSEMLQKEKDQSYAHEQRIRQLELDLEDKSSQVERLNSNLGVMNYENQVEAQQIGQKYNELQQEHDLLKNEIEAYQLRAQNRIAEQAQHINELEGQLKQAPATLDLQNLKRCEHERDQYRDEVVRSWNEIKRLQGILASTEDELHKRTSEQPRLARSIGPRRKSAAYMTPQSYRGRVPAIHSPLERSPVARYYR